MLDPTGNIEGLRSWLSDSDTSSNASSPIPAGSALKPEMADAALSVNSSDGSEHCDPEVAASFGFWMEVGGALPVCTLKAGELPTAVLNIGQKAFYHSTRLSACSLDMVPWIDMQPMLCSIIGGRLSGL